MITFTIDLEDPTGKYEPEGRYVLMARRILDICDEMKRKATFFTVGRVAESAPHLMKDIAARGHEVAYHSHAHVPLTHETPERFREESREDKDRLEQLAGKAVTGFRAPAFSLVPTTVWALDILGTLGFTYSSSIMPTYISRYGFPNAPRQPFRWPNGIIELPLPVENASGFRLPYLGGIYMYAMPLYFVRKWAAQSDTKEILWTYTHPYDLDRKEKFIPKLHGSVWASAILWGARQISERKIKKVLKLGYAPVLADRVNGITSLGMSS